MKTRTTTPKNNKYYIRTVSGGYNGAVQGYPVIKTANVLCNCVGYANGRFNEIGAYGKCKYQLVCNAENFIESAKNQGLKISKKPVLGGIMVWQKGKTLNGNDGAGHVAVVEKVYSDGSILTSESGWNGWAFKTVKRTNANGRWGQANGYKFRGCIINPAVKNEVTKVKEYKITKPYNKFMPAKTLKKGDKGKQVKRLQRFLNWCIGTKLAVDGEFGTKTKSAVKKFQTKYKLDVDGVFGTKSRAKGRAIVAKYTKQTTADKIIIACEEQADWAKDAIYEWQSKPTIEKSKKYETCVTYTACVMQRVGLLKSGKHIWHNGSGFGTGKVTGDTSKFKVTYMKNKTFAQLKDKLKKGDVILCDDNKSGEKGGGGHIMVFSGRWSKKNGNPLVYDQNSPRLLKNGGSGRRSYPKSHKVLAICRAK